MMIRRHRNRLKSIEKYSSHETSNLTLDLSQKVKYVILAGVVDLEEIFVKEKIFYSNL